MEDTGIVQKRRETGGTWQNIVQNLIETRRTYWKLLYRTSPRAWVTPTLTHVVTYELVTSGAEDDAMSQLRLG